MDEEMMGMDVAPVMDPQQMSGQMPPQGMMQQGQAPIQMPQEIQTEIDNLSDQEKSEAKQALMQLTKIVEQMMAEGATEEEINQFLEQIGMTLEELELAEEMFGMGDSSFAI